MLHKKKLKGFKPESVSWKKTLTRGNGLPNTDIMNKNFMPRAFAVFGHCFVASLIVYVPLFIFKVLLELYR
jgi:hypothetical protein